MRGGTTKMVSLTTFIAKLGDLNTDRSNNMTSLPEDEKIVAALQDLKHLASPFAETLSDSQRVTQFCKAVYELEHTLATIRHEEAQKREEAVREERERFEREFGDFAHQYYKGCEGDGEGNWTYGYETEVVYIVADYFKSLTPRDTV